jgi:hypothetical protein
MPIVLGPPTIQSTDDGRVIYRVPVEGFPELEVLWFSVPADAGSFVNPRADAALVALLMPAMARGQDLVVEGPVTDELARALQGEAQGVVHSVRPELSRVDVEVRRPLPAEAMAPGMATGYSAGVDSYATLARHHFAPDVPESLRVTHLLYNNVGSHGHGEKGHALYRKRLERVRPGAASTGLPLIDVDSNLDAFYLAVRLAFQPSHTMRNAAVGHLLSSGIGQYLYASSIPYPWVAVAPRFDLSFADPILLPLLSTSALRLRSSGSDMTRTDKIALIAGVPETYANLDVCVTSTDGANCSECSKCRRTMLTMELLGVLDRYDAVFSRPKNADWREEFLLEALIENRPSAQVIAALYDERVGIPPRLRAEARVRRTVRSAGRFVGRAKRYAKRRIGGLRGG